ncbi:GNAT family N-acetyltransferase [Shewanella woodyi]|uniref:GCN5-related N-acetyltransferase n=1 Tax=Shewanella woodyi (strain ATCC 51908 / MS32) TaxID=392500 RepID=B1KMM9_SHEWM|nr:GNAT family N-acetyltransferase [Shewanella woodyi]ACA87407.1 GCN5-related N-acetyltransferase [Shewanella woodyi ATCC 51908]
MNEFEDLCHFRTPRLTVSSWWEHVNCGVSEVKLAQTVLETLTPGVTATLPEGWQDINHIEDALLWMNDRASESCFLVVQESSDDQVIGFVFLHELAQELEAIAQGADNASIKSELHLGYLLAENYWGKGYASELIAGLVEWAKASGEVKSFVGGVDIDNTASIMVMEKNGFTFHQSEGRNNTLFMQLELDKPSLSRSKFN